MFIFCSLLDDNPLACDCRLSWISWMHGKFPDVANTCVDDDTKQRRPLADWSFDDCGEMWTGQLFLDYLLINKQIQQHASSH